MTLTRSSLFPFVLVAIIACSSASSLVSGSPDGAAPDAGAIDAAGGDGGSVTVACARTIPDACATASDMDCPFPTFAAARAAACCDTGCSVKVSTTPCSGYDIAMRQEIDTVTVEYFDPSTGTPVAVVRHGATVVTTCGAGPASFDAPTCDRAGLACVGGADASAE